MYKSLFIEMIINKQGIFKSSKYLWEVPMDESCILIYTVKLMCTDIFYGLNIIRIY